MRLSDLNYPFWKQESKDLLNFFFGCYFGGLGIYWWQTQSLTETLIENNLSPLIGLFLTGTALMVGYIWGYGNFDVFKKKLCVTLQLKGFAE